MKRPQLTDLINVQILQQIQDAFSELTGMAALITDEEGSPITRSSGFSDFCMHFTRQSEIGCKRCEECDKRGALLTLDQEKPVIYQCHAGLVDYAVPIMVEGQFIGSFIGGQISTQPIDLEQVKKNAREFGLNEEEYLAAADRVAMVEESEVERAAEFLYKLGSIMSEMAYRSNEDLKKSRKLERAAKSQAAFVMNMNTEFQNNMQEWMDSARQALQSEDTETMKESIRRLLVKGPVLLSNFSDTVEYAKMTEGKIELNETAYNIKKLVRFVCHNLQAQLEDQALVINRQIDENVPSKLWGDQGKIGQIINNLLVNVVEHTKEGAIDIHIASETSGYAEKLTIRISAAGMEMTSEHYKYVNHYLKHGDAGFFDGEAGKEISLSMVSFLLKQMSGSIEIERMEGRGTAFVVRLPQLKLV